MSIFLGRYTSLTSYGLQVLIGSTTDVVYQAVLFYTSEKESEEYSAKAYQQLFSTYVYILGGAVAANLLGKKIGQYLGDSSSTRKVATVAGSILGNSIIFNTVQSPIVHGITFVLGVQYLHRVLM